MKIRMLITAMTLALVAPVFAATSALAWHVDTACETIKYDGYAYKVYDGQQMVQDWTKGDTTVKPGVYTVKFENGEKHSYEVPACPEPSMIGRGTLCGDPRAWFQFENTGNVDLKATFSFLPGDKTQMGRRTFTKTIEAGDTRTFGSRWVRGKVRVGVVVDGQWNKLYAYKVRNLRPAPWGEQGCPANRFGTPTEWRVAGSYGRTIDLAR